MKRTSFDFYQSVLRLAIAFGVFSAIAAAQDLNPIRWTIKRENPAAAVKPGDKFPVQIVAAIADGWHLYSLEQPSGGPVPTRIGLPENQKFRLAGDIESPPPQTVFDPNFNLDTEFYEREATFTLPIETAKDAAAGDDTLTASAFYQTCNDKTCLPPKSVKLTLAVKVSSGSQTIGSAAAPKTPTPNQQTQTAQTKKADAQAVEFDFVDFTGKARKISEFRGKYVLLDFWATWCKPCLADIPKLKTLYDKYKASGFEIVGMDSETIGDEEGEADAEFAKQTAERAKQIVATRGVTWTQATAATAVPTAKKLFDVKSLPTKILIDRDGKVVARIGEKDDLNAIVEKLLSENK